MHRRRRIIFLLLSPVLSLAFLSVLWAHRETLRKPSDFERFHANVAAAVHALPRDIGPWMGYDVAVPKEAVKLLKPNAIRGMRFENKNPGKLDLRWVVNYTVVQCRDGNDMLGHYPPVCYPAFGDRQEDARQRTWDVSDKKIIGMEYQFARTIEDERVTLIVYNFMVLPGEGIVRDMESLQKAADNYQQRYYGAAQFQVVFRSVPGNGLTREERDAVFAELLSPSLPLINLIEAGELN